MDTSIATNKNKTAEIEAKFLIRETGQADDVLATLIGSGYEPAGDVTAVHSDRYFDTSDLAIMRAGWACRCRSRDDEHRLVLKSIGTRYDAVFRREEIEQRLPCRFAAEHPLPQGPVQARLAPLVGDAALFELFTVTSRRASFDFDSPGSSAAPLRLDFDRTRVEANHPDEKAPGAIDFKELEFEMDDPAGVEELFGTLRERHGLIPSRFSKFERGLQACGLPTSPARRTPLESPPTAERPVLDLVYFWLDRQRRALIDQEPIAWEGLDPEGVHRMRVAIRRARTALKEFREALPQNDRARIDAELKWLLDELGHVRDADVGEAAIEHYREGLHGDPVEILQPFEMHLRRTAMVAQLELVGVLAGGRFANLLADLEQFIAARGRNVQSNALSSLTVSQCEEELVHTVVRKMRKRGSRLTKRASAEKLHKMRLLAKRLRYLLELFSVSRPEPWQATLKSLRQMQDELGEHQDAIVARKRLADYAASVPLVESNRALLLAMGRLTQQEQDRALRIRRKFRKIWKRFDDSIAPSV